MVLVCVGDVVMVWRWCGGCVVVVVGRWCGGGGGGGVVVV